MKILYKNKHWKIDKEYDINKILYLLIDRPTRINSFNDLYWFNKKDQNHREYDLPDYVSNYGYLTWCINGLEHRKNNKPAKIHSTGHKEHWINGNFIKKEK